MSQRLFHATLHRHLPAIFVRGLVPSFGPLSQAAHKNPCPLHPDPRRIHVARQLLDEGLLSALCFHAVREIERLHGFGDAFLVQHLEPGWLTAQDLAFFGAIIEVEALDEEIHFQERCDEHCTCLEDRDLYLTRSKPVKQYWTFAHLYAALNQATLVEQYLVWLDVDLRGKRRMNDGMYLFEFRPDALAEPCPMAEEVFRPLRARYPRSVTEMSLSETA